MTAHRDFCKSLVVKRQPIAVPQIPLPTYEPMADQQKQFRSKLPFQTRGFHLPDPGPFQTGVHFFVPPFSVLRRLVVTVFRKRTRAEVFNGIWAKDTDTLPEKVAFRHVVRF
jgi:hypothetical protein